jgi:hypothetical protein
LSKLEFRKSPEALIRLRLEFLFHAGNCGFDAVNVGAQITDIGSSTDPGSDLQAAPALLGKVKIRRS